MPNHGEGVEGRVRVLFLEVQLVLLDRANRVAQQLIELGARHARLPLVDVGHKAVHLGRLELEVLEKVVGNLEEGERVELAAQAGGFGGLQRIGQRFWRGLGSFVRGLEQLGSGGVANLQKLPVSQLEQGRQHIDTAFELPGNGFLVLDLVVQHAPRILDDGADLQLKRPWGFCCVFGRGKLRIVPTQIQVQAFVAKFRFGGLNGCHLVGHFNHIKVRLHEVGHLLDFVFVQADHAHTDQVRDPVLDLVGRVALFQGCAVFAAEFANALFHVLDAALDLGDFQPRRSLDQCPDRVHDPGACGLQLRQVVGVEVAELGFFQFQGDLGHGCFQRRAAGNLPLWWAASKCGLSTTPQLLGDEKVLCGRRNGS